MSDQQAIPGMNDETPPNLAPQPSELDMLKARAKLMGIEHSNNISVETLKAKIEAKLAGETPKQEAAPATPPVNPLDMARDADVAAPGRTMDTETAAQVVKPEPEAPKRELSIRQYLILNEMKLVRCRITCLDPKKKDLPGEILTVANEHLGTVRKFVPFGEHTDDGYHIPHCIYTMMRDRKFVSIQTKKVNGKEQIISRDANEFAIEVLPPLTERELHDLAVAQIAAGTVEAAQ